MGCGNSKHDSDHHKAWRFPHNKDLNNWSVKEVSGWYRTLPKDLQKYKAKLLPDEGCVIAKSWTAEFLEKSGVKGRDAARLLTYRDHAKTKSSGPTPLPPAAAAAAAAFLHRVRAPPTPTKADTPSKQCQGLPAGGSSASGSDTPGAGKAAAPVGFPVDDMLSGVIKDLPALLSRSMGMAVTGVHELRLAINWLLPLLPESAASAAKFLLGILELMDMSSGGFTTSRAPASATAPPAFAVASTASTAASGLAPSVAVVTIGRPQQTPVKPIQA